MLEDLVRCTSYIVDGIKVRGTMGVPTSAIEQITVVTGGLPKIWGRHWRSY